MSAEFDLAVVLGAPLKLSSSVLISSLTIAQTAVASSAAVLCSHLSAVSGLVRFFCCPQQRSLLRSASASMRLRPKRTSSGVKCFGGYHINRSSHLFLFLRGGLT